ncbi:sulfatase [Dyadobacter psychrotolerans]|uniref:DUF4976 domain-containing protein n=1 Tax=Dyadobacter psychrotolerans TaxID=2541721 RepID=A0A4R5DF69_9BACT|nr:sulfatase [Dyadobacter psychrotolerans]TDE09013.1 DUF4976 domain-containing protein [Dyadobacter psychrotolerans]
MHLSIKLVFLILLSVGACGQKVANEHSSHPNIIFFLVDDMGWQDTSVAFWQTVTAQNRLYSTPNMERLAGAGMKFTQAYTSAVCSPSRCSLISGMNAARHRVTNWTLERNTSKDAVDEKLTFPLWNVNGIQPVDSIERSTYITPLPEILRKNGYFTIHVGKAHFAARNTPGADPLSFGFDINVAGHASGGPASYQAIENYGNDQNGHAKSVWSVPGLEKYHATELNLTEALTLEAKAAMDSAQACGKPFYLYMSHYAVHVPLQPHDPYYAKYRTQGLDQQQAVYASMIEGMDKSLGDLMDYVRIRGIENNTVIIFLSDNGGYTASAKVRGGQPHSHNRPLNSGKGSAYEGGIRVPMIVKWPGKTNPATASAQYLIAEDFFPSILEMAGIHRYKTIQKVDGKSFVAQLSGNNTDNISRDLIWHFPNKWEESGPGIGPTSTLRQGDWKLIFYYHDSHFELFDIRSDIGELQNLADQQPDRVKKMSADLGRRLRSMHAQRPAHKATGQLVAWPDEIGKN